MPKIVKPSVEILTPDAYLGERALRHIERCGRTCYQSFDKMSEDSHFKFAQMILRKGHLTVIEHISVSVKIVCDRGITHELVRHRLTSPSQESTNYCDYNGDRFGGELTFIKPFFFDEGTEQYEIWYRSIVTAEADYKRLRELGAEPKEARSVLPNSLKAEIIITANLREWRHVFALRCSSAAHPQMRQVMRPLLYQMNKAIPVIFEDLYQEYIESFVTISNVMGSENQLQDAQ